MRFEIGAELYDAVAEVTGRDAAHEADRVRAAWRSAITVARPRLLDVACGTGMHLAHFRPHAEISGADHSGAMLCIAARRLPGVPLFEQSMENLELDAEFDVITCLLSGIAYPLGEVRLHRALRRMRRHLAPGGVVIVEPGPAPDSVERLDHEPLLFEMRGVLVERRTRWSLHGSELVLHHEFRMSTGARRTVLHELHEITLRDLHAHREAMERAGLETRLVRPADDLPPLLVGRAMGGESAMPVPASVDRD